MVWSQTHREQVLTRNPFTVSPLARRSSVLTAEMSWEEISRQAGVGADAYYQWIPPI